MIRLRPEKEQEYRRLHQAPWPSILDTLRAAKVTNYSIFVLDGLLFSYLEYTGDDYPADMARIATDPETQAWWRLTDPCQQPLNSTVEGQWWVPAEELFHLD